MAPPRQGAFEKMVTPESEPQRALDAILASTKERGPSSIPGDANQRGEDDNLLFSGENLEVMEALCRAKPGEIKLVYIDPPFATGHAWHYSPEPQSASGGSNTGRSAVQAQAYDDAWGDNLDAYISWMRKRLVAIHELLHPEGSLLLHCDHRANHHLSILCDEIFGPGDRRPGPTRAGFRNEIIWAYGLGGSSPRCYPKKHDTILWYSKGDQWTFKPPMVPATSAKLRGKLKKAPDTWQIPALNNMAQERTGYPTQKPLALLQRIIEAHTEPGDTVADFFSGSGTTILAAEQAQRRWIGCDETQMAVHVAKKRLLTLPETQPFRVIEANDTWCTPPPLKASELRARVLEAYGARAVHTNSGFHGDKNGILIWVAGRDQIISSKDVKTLEERSETSPNAEIHILGWQWALNDAVDCGSSTRSFVLIQLPRTLLKSKDRLPTSHLFIERPRLEARIERASSNTLRVHLERFWYAHPNLLPVESPESDPNGLDLLDLWGVDRGDTRQPFQYSWASSRNRKVREIERSSACLPSPSSEPSSIRIRAFDVFGNGVETRLDLDRIP